MLCKHIVRYEGRFEVGVVFMERPYEFPADVSAVVAFARSILEPDESHCQYEYACTAVRLALVSKTSAPWQSHLHFLGMNKYSHRRNVVKGTVQFRYEHSYYDIYIYSSV